MRSLLFLLLFLSFAITLQAQNFSLGLRSGIAIWHGSSSCFTASKPTTIWEKELFTRYEFKKHFAIELGLNTFKGPNTSPECYTAGDADNYAIDEYYENHYYLLNLRIQYGFSFGKLKRLKNYAGIVLAPGQDHLISYTDYRRALTGEITTQIGTFEEYLIQAGIEDRIQYDLTKHLQVHTLLSYKLSTEDPLPGKCFSAQFGAAWKF